MNFKSMLRTLALLISYCTFAVLPAVEIGSVGVGKLEFVGVDPDLQASLRLVVRDEMRSVLPNSFTESPKPKTVIQFSFTRLASKFLIYATMLQDSKVIRSRDLAVSSAEELDVGVNRLLSSLAEDLSLPDTAGRGSAVGAETSTPRRVRSTRGVGVSVGGWSPVSNAFNSYVPLYSFGINLMFDVDRFITEGRLDFGSGSSTTDVFMFSGTLGTHYAWWNERQYSLFTGLQLGFGAWNGEPKSSQTIGTAGLGSVSEKLRARGFLVGIDTGALLMRHADINLDVRLRTAILADKMNGAVPALVGLAMGIRF